MNASYSGQDVALIIPTKDRPAKLNNLLESIALQTTRCGRVIVVDGGRSVKDIVLGFGGSLPVEYYSCNLPGQIRQRNMGIALLDAKAPLVGFLDDDIVLEPRALENMIHCWNRVERETAGIGFNIVNQPPHNHSFVRYVMLSGSSVPGSILLSGANVPFQNVQSDIKSQFLGGGYTIWKRSILDEFPQENLDTRWAWGEDVRFSYPIGKKYPLYACASAKVRHEHVYDQAPPDHVHRYQGRKGALAIFYFVTSHPELSRSACLWMLVTSAIANFVYGFITWDPPLLKYGIGRAEGIFICLKGMVGLTDLRKELED